MRRLFLTFTFCFTLYIGIGQIDNIISDPDTIRSYFPKTYGTKKWKPLVGFDAHRSFYSGAPVKINGLRFGAEYLGVHRFGVGFYGLKRDVIFENIPVDHPVAWSESKVKFKVGYAAIFYERVFYKTPKWEVAIPAYLAAGGVEGFVEDSLGFYHRFDASSFSALSTGGAVKYYIFSWFAARVGIGQRFMFNTEKSIRKAFNAPYYSLGFSILVGELYREIVK